MSYDFEAKKIIGDDECFIRLSAKGVYWSKTRIVKEEVPTPTTSTNNPYRESAKKSETVVKRFVLVERYIPWESIVSVGTTGTAGSLNAEFTQTLRFFLAGLEDPVYVPFGLHPNLCYDAMQNAMFRISN